MIFKNEYGSYKIVFDSSTGVYQAEDADGAIIRDNFKYPEKLAESLDNLEKRKAQRIKVLCSQYRGHEFTEAEATPYAGASGWRSAHEAWIVTNGSRQKVVLSKLCLDTPDNRALFATMKAIDEEREKLEEQNKHLYKSIPKLTPEMFEEEG